MGNTKGYELDNSRYTYVVQSGVRDITNFWRDAINRDTSTKALFDRETEVAYVFDETRISPESVAWINENYNRETLGIASLAESSSRLVAGVERARDQDAIDALGRDKHTAYETIYKVDGQGNQVPSGLRVKDAYTRDLHVFKFDRERGFTEEANLTTAYLNDYLAENPQPFFHARPSDYVGIGDNLNSSLVRPDGSLSFFGVEIEGQLYAIERGLGVNYAPNPDFVELPSLPVQRMARVHDGVERYNIAQSPGGVHPLTTPQKYLDHQARINDLDTTYENGIETTVHSAGDFGCALDDMEAGGPTGEYCVTEGSLYSQANVFVIEEGRELELLGQVQSVMEKHGVSIPKGLIPDGASQAFEDSQLSAPDNSWVYHTSPIR